MTTNEPVKLIGCHSVAEKLKNKLIQESILSQAAASVVEDVLIEILDQEGE